MNATSETAAREIASTRVYDAPRELVYEAWTKPEHLTQWWGPRGFTTTTLEMDMRAGGKWRNVMHGPDGTDYPNRIMFVEVIPNERIVYDHDADGDPNDPHRFHVTVTFEDVENGKTRMHFRMLFETADERDRIGESGATEGLQQTLDRLGEFVVARKVA